MVSVNHKISALPLLSSCSSLFPQNASSSPAYQDIIDSWRRFSCEPALTCFFHFMRRFWYQVFTCIWVRSSARASSSRSEVLRYFCALNRRSRPTSCTSATHTSTAADLRRTCHWIIHVGGGVDIRSNPLLLGFSFPWSNI